MKKRFYVYQINKQNIPEFVVIVDGTVDDAREVVKQAEDGTYSIQTETSSPIEKTTEQVTKARLKFAPATRKPRKVKAQAAGAEVANG